MENFFQKYIEKTSGRKRIRERGINWKEMYTEKTKPIKKRFDKSIGDGAYVRWEGHDYETNGDYFVVVGPAISPDGHKSFFAGIKRLPDKYKRKKVYAPSGEYFTNISSALSHAREMWGIPYPPGQTPYSASDLEDVYVPRHMKG